MLDLLEQYTRDSHLSSLQSYLPALLSLTNLETIFSSSWDSQNEPPYIVTTCLLDSYYCLPERPDMAFVHLWMAFNNSYNHLFRCNNYRDLNQVVFDSKGLNESVNEIHAQLSTMIPGKTEIMVGDLLFEYIQKIPTKILRFIGNLLLKGLAIEQANPQISKLFQSRSYDSLKKKFPEIVNPISQTYGEAYLRICNVTFDSTDLTINMGITDLGRSRSISYSLGSKLKELICNKTVELFDRSDNDQKLTIMLNDKKWVEFIIVGIIYSIRNNQMHGNIASRLNSNYANEASFESSVYIYLLTHYLLSLLMYVNGQLSVSDLAINVRNLDLALTEN